VHENMAQQRVPNYLVPSILATIFCCVPLGIVAIVYSAQVNSKLEAGDFEGAVKASENAKKWCWIAFAAGIAVFVIYFLIALSSGS
jgi:hypothetical protein